MIISNQKVRDYFALARLSNTPTLVTNVTVGCTYSLDGKNSLASILMLAAPIVLLYTAGMFMNDYCDADVDRVERPQRPHASGRVSKREMQIVMILLVALAWSILSLTNLQGFLSGICLTLLIVIYNRYHKSTCLAPLLMASCRLFAYITPFLACAANPLQVSWSYRTAAPGLAIICFVSGLTYVAAFETRQTVDRYWPVALLFSPLLLIDWWAHGIIASVAAMLFALSVTCSIWLTYKGGKNILIAVGCLIATIPLMDAIILAKHLTGSLLVIMVVCAGATHIAQRFIPAS